MAANLVVIAGKEICFSNFIKKPNGLSTRIDLIHFLDISRKRFIIPIRMDGMISLVNIKHDPVFSDYKIDPGPLNISVHESCVNELCLMGSSINLLPIPHMADSYYVRSNDYQLESAATAASFIYRKPETVYREAFKATGENILPFFVGDIRTIEKKMDILLKLDDELMALEKTGHKKKMEQKIKEMDKITGDFETFFEFKRFSS